MYDFYYTKLLEDPTKFQPRTGNKYIDFTCTGNGSIETSESYIDEVDMPQWIKSSAFHNPGLGSREINNCERSVLKLLIGSPEKHHSDAEILPLPISQVTFELLRNQWNMPTELLRMMLSSLPLALPFTTRSSCDQVLDGFIFRGARSRDWNFCLAIIHNAMERRTLAIVSGMQENETQMLLTCLKHSTEHIHNPMLLPVFLLELKTNYFALLLEKRAVALEDIEYTTGMRHGFSQDPQRNRRKDLESGEKLRSLDFHSITQKLTGLTGTLGFCDMTFESSKKALELVVSCRARIKTRQKSSVNSQYMAADSAFDRRVEYLCELIAGSQALGDVLTARTKAQVQTVYSLIGQRDNRLNVETAAAAKEISEISLLHNAAMTTIAEDSRDVAMLTRRDSVDMRIIAAMTLVFLPGAYIATLFGSNLFQFIPSGSDTVVSKWIWLYWVLNVSVTLIVLAIWWQFSRKQRRSSNFDKPQFKSDPIPQPHSALERQTSDVLSAQSIPTSLNRIRSRSTGSGVGTNLYGAYVNMDTSSVAAI